MKITSSEFNDSGFIPKKFTCQGEDINPSLILQDVPPQAKSIVLIIDDPDAPGGMWVHWVVYDIPVCARIEEHSVPGTQGINDFRRKEYGGPCPPSGTHRYFFKVYALDTILHLAEGKSKSEVERAMQGHVLSQVELVGLYKKQ